MDPGFSIDMLLRWSKEVSLQTKTAHVKSKCDYFSESSHHVGFKSWLAHSLYMSDKDFLTPEA